MCWKACGKSGRGLILGSSSALSWIESEKTMKTLSLDIQSPSLNLNPGPSKYERRLGTRSPMTFRLDKKEKQIRT